MFIAAGNISIFTCEQAVFHLVLKIGTIVEKFWNTIKEDDPFATDVYQITVDLITDIRLKMAMPHDLEKAKEARSGGTAMLTVPEAVKTNEWLKKNGIEFKWGMLFEWKRDNSLLQIFSYCPLVRVEDCVTLKQLNWMGK